MKLRDVLLAVLATIIWGFSFVAIKVGLDSFSAPQLTALRFMVAALPVLFVPRPAISWPMLIMISTTLFSGQFLFLFFAFKFGMPPGLASVTAQSQVFFTILLAAIFLGDHPRLRQYIGIVIAVAGLVVIGFTIGGDLTMTGLLLALAGSFSWGIGNVLTKHVKDAAIFPLVIWCSLLAPIPALVFSAFDSAPSLVAALAHASWGSILSVIYIGTIGTVLVYAIWGSLLRRYPTSLVAPFALLVPGTAIASTMLVFGEVFGFLRYVGMALILVGLAVIVLPVRGAPAQTLP